MKILQIIPAEGWVAVYAGPHGTIFTEPLVCWALVDGYEERDGEEIVGMTSEDGDVLFVQGDTFLGHAGPGTDYTEFRNRSRKITEDSNGEL